MRSAQVCPVYVINLPTRPARWRWQRIQAAIRGYVVERVPAHDGTAGRARFPDSPLSDGALGLWSTVLDLVNDLADKGVHSAVVLEDDALLLPGFFQRVQELNHTEPRTALVQVGSLGPHSWRPKKSVRRNLKRALPTKAEIKDALRGRYFSRTDHLVTDIRDGTHALLIYPAELSRLFSEINVAEMPLDTTLRVAAKTHPGRLLRTTKNFAVQVPVASDISRSPKNL